MADHFRETSETWNKIAELYDEKFAHLELYLPSYNQLLEKLNDDAAVLDLGCGPGIISRYLKSQRELLQITGMDIAPNMIELAKQHIPDGAFLTGDCRMPDFPGDTFDAVIAGFLLPYFDEAETQAFFHQTAKILKPGGLFYASYVPGKTDESGFKSSNFGRVYFHYHERDFLANELQKSGFSVLSESEVDFPRGESTEKHAIILAEKPGSASNR